MKILNRFLLQHFIRILSLCISAFVGIYLLIDFLTLLIKDFEGLK